METGIGNGRSSGVVSSAIGIPRPLRGRSLAQRLRRTKPSAHATAWYYVQMASALPCFARPRHFWVPAYYKKERRRSSGRVSLFFSEERHERQPEQPETELRGALKGPGRIPKPLWAGKSGYYRTAARYIGSLKRHMSMLQRTNRRIERYMPIKKRQKAGH